MSGVQGLDLQRVHPRAFSLGARRTRRLRVLGLLRCEGLCYGQGLGAAGCSGCSGGQALGASQLQCACGCFPVTM